MQVQLLLNTDVDGDLAALYRIFGITLPQPAPEQPANPVPTPPDDPAVVGSITPDSEPKEPPKKKRKRRTKAEMEAAKATTEEPPAVATPESVAPSAQLLDAVDITLKYAAAFGTERLSQRMAEAKIERLENEPAETAQPFLRKLLNEVEIQPHIQRVIDTKGPKVLQTALAGKRIGEVGTLAEQVAFLEGLL